MLFSALCVCVLHNKKKSLNTHGFLKEKKNTTGTSSHIVTTQDDRKVKIYLKCNLQIERLRNDLKYPRAVAQ